MHAPAHTDTSMLASFQHLFAATLSQVTVSLASVAHLAITTAVSAQYSRACTHATPTRSIQYLLLDCSDLDTPLFCIARGAASLLHIDTGHAHLLMLRSHQHM